MRLSALDPRRLRRREVPLTEAQRLSAAMMTAPVAACAHEEWRRAHPPRLFEEGLAALADVEDAGAKLSALIAAGEAASRRRLGATFIATPAAETRPMPAVPVGDEDEPEVIVLKKVLNGLNGLNWDALEAARENERETYARTTGAPFHNTLLKEWRTPLGDPARPAWRPPARRVRRHYAAVARRAGDVRDLAYPAITGFTAPGADDLYAELLRQVSVITGTTGIGNWLPEPVAGGAA